MKRPLATTTHPSLRRTRGVDRQERPNGSVPSLGSNGIGASRIASSSSSSSSLAAPVQASAAMAAPPSSRRHSHSHSHSHSRSHPTTTTILPPTTAPPMPMPTAPPMPMPMPMPTPPPGWPSRGGLVRLGVVIVLLYGLFAAFLVAMYRDMVAAATTTTMTMAAGESGAAAPLEVGVNSVVRGGGTAAGPGAGRKAAAAATAAAAAAAAAASAEMASSEASASASALENFPLYTGSDANPATGITNGAAGGRKGLLGGRLMRRRYERGTTAPGAGAARGRGKIEAAAAAAGGDAEDRDSPDDIGLDAGGDGKDDEDDDGGGDKGEEEGDTDDSVEHASGENDDHESRDAPMDADNDVDQKHFGREGRPAAAVSDGTAKVGERLERFDNEGGVLHLADKSAFKAPRHDNHVRPVLTAYLEPVYQSDWTVTPLPVRNATASTLEELRFPGLTSCSGLPGQFPIDEPSPTDVDPFLPWIHDVFPTSDGRHVQFVAQNKRRCQSGRMMGKIKRHMQPQASLFQHVPVKRVKVDETTGGDKNDDDDDDDDDETRYRLCWHGEADPDGVETRFICRFHSSEGGAGGTSYETLSDFNFDYDYHTYRKGYRTTFTEEGFDNHMIWTSQLLFRCPVPAELQDRIKSGETVVNDYATWFVDVVPIRTPPRYGHPTEFFPPRYKAEAEHAKGRPDVGDWFDAGKMWGTEHILPRIVDSGRWANVPICKPSLLTYAHSFADADSTMKGGEKMTAHGPTQPRKVEVVTDPDGTEREVERKWDLIACVWTSASFYTRGERRHITDNVDRLREWLEFNILAGFDHVFVYDNTAAQSDLAGESLAPVTDLFPGRVTRIEWPCKVCNNRPGTGDNKGERSSQYAAESSCRLRFGAHTDWIGSFDIDEYITPMGDYGSMKELLRHLDEEDVKILSFKSKRAWPRLDFLEDPAKTYFKNKDTCPKGCFHPKVRDDVTFMQTHNCNLEKPPRQNLMPAEKQIYKANYVLLHFVHYSTVTRLSILNREQTIKAGYKWLPMYKDRHTRVADEIDWATMLHGKSIVFDQTEDHENKCRKRYQLCKLAFPFPEGKDHADDPVEIDGGFIANCFLNKKIENYWVPRLEEALKRRGKPLAIS